MMRYWWLALIFVMAIAIPVSGQEHYDFPREYDHFTWETSWEEWYDAEEIQEGRLGHHFYYDFTVHDLQFPVVNFKIAGMYDNCLYWNSAWETVAYLKDDTGEVIFRANIIERLSEDIPIENGRYQLVVRISVNESRVDRGVWSKGIIQMRLKDDSMGVDEPWYFFAYLYPEELPNEVEHPWFLFPLAFILGALGFIVVLVEIWPWISLAWIRYMDSRNTNKGEGDEGKT